MDQIKIGKFIAQVRKGQSLTQRQLAEKLGISDKTVSKWECGNGLPEISLMLPLCNALGISVNELLSGEILKDIDYKKKAEENMMSLLKEKEENKKKLKLSFMVGIPATATFIVLILLVCIYTDVMPVPLKVMLVLFACVIFGIGLYVTMQFDREAGYFVCKHCGESFTPSWKNYLWAPHTFSRRYMKCPHCGKRSNCTRILTKD